MNIARSSANPDAGLNREQFKARSNAQAEQLFRPAITDHMLRRCGQASADDPVLRQFLPASEELQTDPTFSVDPVHDAAFTRETGLLQKYAGRVLLIVNGHCAVNCRYCFRRHFDYAANHISPRNLERAITALQTDPEVHEVILSGGDPLTSPVSQLRRLSDALATVPHLRTLRIHSRVPVVAPELITDEWLDWLQQLRFNRVLVIHSNHAREFSSETAVALRRIAASGTLLLNQSVLLKGVNDDAAVLAELSHTLLAHGVLPYYLHQMDRVQNAAHFFVDDKRARALHRQLMQALPGYLVPKLVQEIPDRAHKIPL